MKTKKRKEIIIQFIKQYGYKDEKGNYLISISDLANNINNCWEAEHFVTKKTLKYLDQTEKRIVFEWWATQNMSRAIKSTIGNELILIPNGNRQEYIYYIKEKGFKQLENDK